MSWKEEETEQESLGTSVYADKVDAEKEPAKKLFNCYQRAHQNTLENMPGFLVLLGTASIENPAWAAGAGLVWLLGRLVYAHGYYSGIPSKRNRGAFSYLGLLTLLTLSVRTCLRATVYA